MTLVSDQYSESFICYKARDFTLTPNALTPNAEGSLVLKAVLLADGTIRELKVTQSSGYKILDDAAINIVRRVGTFAPFSSDMKKHYDQLEITRKWQFSKDGKTPLLSGGKF